MYIYRQQTTTVTRSPKYHNTIDGEYHPKQSRKNLGMYMDHFMLFDKHINEVTQKVTGTMVFSKRVSATPINQRK